MVYLLCGYCLYSFRKRGDDIRMPLRFFNIAINFLLLAIMNNYTVYILLCSDQSYYVGVTNDIEARVLQHNEGINKKAYTYARRPVKLVFQDHFHDINQAIAFEKQIKGWRRAKKEALIKGEWGMLPRLSIAYHKKK